MKNYSSPTIKNQQTEVSWYGLAFNQPRREPSGGRQSRWILALIFIGALFLRMGFVVLTPQMDTDIDLCINREMGDLAARGLNPYNYNDHPDLRRQLRTDQKAYDEGMARSQELWDYYVSSNLPLTVLVLGAIELVDPSPRAYRLAFALFDSLLAVLVVVAVHRLWGGIGATRKTLLGLSLAACSPVLLLSGTISPEVKGVQILLMVAAILCALSSRRGVRRFAAPVMAGASAAFMGIGLLIVPLCALWAAWEPGEEDGKILLKAAGFMVIAAAVAGLTMAPYFPHDFLVAWTRLKGSFGGGGAVHDSLWRIVAHFLPERWRLLQYAVLAGTCCLVGWASAKKRLPLEFSTAVALILFVMVSLTNGSLDRMNIAATVAILLVGSISVQYGTILALTWFAGGAAVAGVAVLAGDYRFAHIITGFAKPVQGFLSISGWTGSILGLAFCVVFAVCVVLQVLPLYAEKEKVVSD